MKRSLIAAFIALSLLFRSEIYAAQPKNNPPGTAAAEGKESALKWGIATGGMVAFASIFGIILYLASTDPTSFAHSHSH